MVRIFSPDRSELQNAFANQFKNIVRKQAKRKALIEMIRDYLLMFFVFMLAVAIVCMLSYIGGS